MHLSVPDHLQLAGVPEVVVRGSRLQLRQGVQVGARVRGVGGEGVPGPGIQAVQRVVVRVVCTQPATSTQQSAVSRQQSAGVRTAAETVGGDSAASILTEAEVVGELPAHDALLDKGVHAASVRLSRRLHPQHRGLRRDLSEVQVRGQPRQSVRVRVVALVRVAPYTLLCTTSSSV